MTLHEIGQTLKQERKRQQLSLDEVFASTKIGLNILQAIEEADTDQLPHHVYTRGFIRNYAEFLGLSGAEMVQAFDRAMQEEAEAHSERGSRRGGRDNLLNEDRERRGSWRYFGLTLVLLLVLGALVYYFYLGPRMEGTEKATAPAVAENATQQQEAEKAKEAEESASSEDGTAPSETVAQQEAVSGARNESKATAAAEEEDTQRSPSAQPSAAGPSETEPRETELSRDEPTSRTEAEANATEPDRSAASQESAVNGTPEVTASGETSAEQPPLHELRIVASEACWINADVQDGTRDLYLEPGGETTIRFRGTGDFLLGNAGGVTVYFNGEKLPIQAESGEVREITLP